jgi:hypothetical protein
MELVGAGCDAEVHYRTRSAHPIFPRPAVGRVQDDHQYEPARAALGKCTLRAFHEDTQRGGNRLREYGTLEELEQNLEDFIERY